MEMDLFVPIDTVRSAYVNLVRLICLSEKTRCSTNYSPISKNQDTLQKVLSGLDNVLVENIDQFTLYLLKKSSLLKTDRWVTSEVQCNTCQFENNNLTIRTAEEDPSIAPDGRLPVQLSVSGIVNAYSGCSGQNEDAVLNTALKSGRKIIERAHEFVIPGDQIKSMDASTFRVGHKLDPRAPRADHIQFILFKVLLGLVRHFGFRNVCSDYVMSMNQDGQPLIDDASLEDLIQEAAPTASQLTPYEQVLLVFFGNLGVVDATDQNTLEERVKRTIENFRE